MQLNVLYAFSVHLKNRYQPGMVALNCNFIMWETQAGGLLSSRLTDLIVRSFLKKEKTNKQVNKNRYHENYSHKLRL